MEKKWEQLSPSTVPSARFGNRMCWDPTQSVVVMYGGDTGLAQHQTWTWDGTDWTLLSPATDPGTRGQYGFCYDENNGYAVRYGGMIPFPFTVYNDTWTWDGTDWTNQSPATDPGIRQWPCIVWDDSNGYSFMFGGSDGVVFRYSTSYSWDGTDWNLETPATTTPLGRYQHAMGFDRVSGTVIMFGGSTSAGTSPQDTWEWDGTDWTQLSPATTPTPKVQMMMDWDPGSQRLLMFGGRAASIVNEVWAWNRTDWELVDICDSSPPSARGNCGWCHDDNMGKMLLNGGDLYVPSTPERTNETWSLGRCPVGVQVMRWW